MENGDVEDGDENDAGLAEGIVIAAAADPPVQQGDDGAEGDDGDSNVASDEGEVGLLGNSDDGSSSSSSEAGDPEDAEEFDLELPTLHSYIEGAVEVSGRTVHDSADSEPELPLVAHPGVILMPGQTVPMTFFNTSQISMMRRLVGSSDKTFAVVNRRHNVHRPAVVEEDDVGTTAEIFQYSDRDSSFHIKAKGRQRFRVLSIRQQIDGIRLARLEILEEITLPDPLFEMRLRCLDCRRTFLVDEEEGEEEPAEVALEEVQNAEAAAGGSLSGSSPQTGTSSPLSRVQTMVGRVRRFMNRREIEMANKDEFMPKRRTSTSFRLSRRNHLRSEVYKAPLTRWPNWVYEMYDPQVLVERIHEEMAKLRLFSQTAVNIPRDPQELSFWVASNLPFDDFFKSNLLRISCTVQRLRYEISILEKINVLCCKSCGVAVGRYSDIFSMSKDGPQGNYVNPSGYVHETLTFYRVKNIKYDTERFVEHSWFPGYAWQICCCLTCSHHLGWRFTCQEGRKLHPKKFYGLSRQSIVSFLHMQAREESGSASPEDVPRSPHLPRLGLSGRGLRGGVLSSQHRAMGPDRMLLGGDEGPFRPIM